MTNKKSHFFKKKNKKKNKISDSVVRMDQYNVIANQPIVIDNGSGMVKAGFAGDEIPKCNFRNSVSRPKHEKVMAGALEGDTFIGQVAEDNRGRLPT